MKKAVALSYKAEAPEVTAKGKGKVAENIIATAEKNEIPVYEDKNLANLLTEVEIGSQIPEEVYELVAKILIMVGDIDELYAKIK
ncbi:EscU/YscU/HrcU family type III secretion system export apparatus switch protein [Candidatus Epulonipiscium viviparus]|uniref:EscU/YscU/HrcU family type III secretion system export apparatus switch protein n=1 Tax=Candidatus Epulonipiscium viviparus TaxID=420336 RepID=UPI00016C003F|nr:EscU/YscU/HrcU family type III secretion system export apparatus switch protein [Candidatus Epulopiscium viviparus]